MNAHQRRKALRARTHYVCDFCRKFQRLPYRMLTGCPWCWSASARRQRVYLGVDRPTPDRGGGVTDRNG